MAYRFKQLVGHGGMPGEGMLNDSVTEKKGDIKSARQRQGGSAAEAASPGRAVR